MNHYLVSARKYRPTTFDSVVGQRALTTTLKNAIAQGKLAHAYLFCGPRGVGKTTCARIFAKTINCLNPTEQGEACNECESCRAFNEQRSYNIHELDAASNNSVEDIRGLIEQVQIPPQIGRYKVFIIDEVHMLSNQAFNAFLKTLEEPPAHAIFIMATTEKHKILPTILSRCQIYDFSRITPADTVAHLQYVAEKEGITCEPEALHVIAEKADGGMRDALSIFDRVSSFCKGNITYSQTVEDLNVLDYDQYFAMTDHLLKGEIPAAMVRLNGILDKGFEANYFIGGIASHFRNLLMCRDAQTLPLLDVSEKVRQRYHEQAMRTEPKFIYRALKLCNDCDMNYRTSRNKRLLVELTLIEVAQAASGDDEGCGRSPIRRLKPLFNHLDPAPQAAPAAEGKTARTDSAAPQAYAQQTPVVRTVQESITAGLKPQPAHNGRVAKVLSLRSIREQIHRTESEQAQKSAVTTQPASTAERQCTPFNNDRLTYYWFRFAQQLPKEQAALQGRMKAMKPAVNEKWEVHVTVDNEMVEQYMRNIQVSLTNYLRTQLLNDYISLQFHIASMDEQPRAFSRVEKFKDMLRRSPALEELRKALDLELA